MADYVAARARVFADVNKARENADLKWGRRTGADGPWLENPHLGAAVLMEEVGEVSRAILERDPTQVRAELVDVAQVAVAWLESIQTTDGGFYEGKGSRPGWDDYFLHIAKAVSARADCSRFRHGAVIVSTDQRIVATGYNGGVSGGPSCLAGECPRAITDTPRNHPDYSNCIALHAEQNAIAYADRSRTDGGSIYITGPPCDMCSKLIAAAGIVRVVVP